MPEYLSPGVYVEEVSFRSKSIEGVPTSTTGFAGMTRFGPVRYPNCPLTNEPRLITSFTEFERVYGGLERLILDGGIEREAFLGHAARAFFNNGGKRLYVARVFNPSEGDEDGIARATIALGGGAPSAIWQARWPGSFGNVLVETRVVRSKNIAYDHPQFNRQVRQVRPGAVIEVFPALPLPPDNDPPQIGRLRLVNVANDGRQTFQQADGTDAALGATDLAVLVELRVIVTVDPERIDVYDQLGVDPRQKRDAATRILQLNDPEDENAVVWLNWTAAAPEQALQLVVALRGTGATGQGTRLAGGDDGEVPMPDQLRGEAADPDIVENKATGLEALGEVDDIAIVALPDVGAYDDITLSAAAADHLIAHCEILRYRVGIVDAPAGSSINEIRAFRSRFDTKYAAIYHPWIEILDPTERASQGAPPRRLLLPPSGFVAGIYARSDIERGVHKAPANEVVRGLTRFESNINKARQDVLNPDNINALRFFENRGNRVWGARTLSSDPEWKYVNVRRLFVYIEHSLDKGTQWAVFEPNNSRLWANIRETVENFLLVLWRDGALLGDKPEDAFFVRCDRTTMTQNDLDNGRLIVLIGVAPVKPAEFVIFRIGQFTADSKS
jgi:uncharacterized protein